MCTGCDPVPRRCNPCTLARMHPFTQANPHAAQTSEAGAAVTSVLSLSVSASEAGGMSGPAPRDAAAAFTDTAATATSIAFRLPLLVLQGGLNSIGQTLLPDKGLRPLQLAAAGPAGPDVRWECEQPSPPPAAPPSPPARPPTAPPPPVVPPGLPPPLYPPPSAPPMPPPLPPALPPLAPLPPLSPPSSPPTPPPNLPGGNELEFMHFNMTLVFTFSDRRRRLVSALRADRDLPRDISRRSQGELKRDIAGDLLWRNLVREIAGPRHRRMAAAEACVLPSAYKAWPKAAHDSDKARLLLKARAANNPATAPRVLKQVSTRVSNRNTSSDHPHPGPTFASL